MAWTVTSTSTVCGKSNGATLTDTDLAGCNIAALVAGGHLTETVGKPAKATKPVAGTEVDYIDPAVTD